LMVAVRDRRDITAFESLVKRWDAKLASYLIRLVGDMGAALDLRQETYFRVWRSAATYDDAYAFSTWIVRIATNLANTHRIRNRHESRPWTAERGPEESVCGLEPILKGERESLLARGIARLPQSDRALILMRFQLALSYREIADLLSSPESTVKSRMTTLLRRLHRELATQGIEARSILP